MNKCKVFYSWQSDRKPTSRFISKCLNKLNGKKLDFTVYEVERDTVGVAGSPDISSTVFSKIDEADLFVADITLVSPPFAKRKTPNPNVLIELGYAVKALGWHRIVLLHNSDFGGVEKLPFDIRHRRVTSFSMKGDEEQTFKDIVGRINSSVRLLAEQGLLHGGNPTANKAKRELEEIISANLGIVYGYYFADMADIDAHFSPAVVTENYIRDAITVKDSLTKEQFDMLTRLLDLMQKSGKDTEDKYGWEYASEIVALCSEPLYVEYADRIAPLTKEATWKKEFVELYNLIASPENRVVFSQDRVVSSGDKVFVALSTGEELVARDKDGNLLCKFKYNEEGRAEGYKTSYTYKGYYKDGLRHGEGKEYSTDYEYVAYYDENAIVREGEWQNGEFVQGTVYNAVLFKNGEGVLERICYDNKFLLASETDLLKFQMNEERPNNCKRYYTANLKYENGEYEIIEDTVIPVCATLGGKLEMYTCECEESV